MISPSTSEQREIGTDKRNPSRGLVFGIVAVALFMTSVDVTIVATALPAIHRSLHASINWAGWTITIYGLGMVIALPTAGKFSNQFGRRRVFICGVSIFATSSLLCGFSTNIYILIVFRALQALGGGAFQPSAAGLVADHFGKDRDRGIGMFGTIAAAGQVTGPILGGLIVGYFSWRWIFFVNVPISVVLIYLIVRFIPQSKTIESAKTDVRGLILMATFVLTAILGITNLGNRHAQLDDPTFIAPEICALILGWLFVRHTKRAEAPFIPMRLLTAKGYAVMNLENVLIGVVSFGVASLVPLYAQERYHLSVLSSGTLLTARAVGLISIGAIATFALRRTGYRVPLIGGFSLFAIGTLIMSLAPKWGISPFAWLFICSAITGLGGGAANPASRNASLQFATNDVAAITGLRAMFVYLGIIFGVSIDTAILNRSPNPGLMQAHIMWVVIGIIVFVMIPLVFRIPDHKGSW